MPHAKTSNTVSVRLPPSVQAALSERAQQIGMTTHQYAKAILIEEVSNARLHRLEDGLNTLQRGMNEFRDDFIFLVSNLLCKQGTFTAEEAKRWVQTHFGNPKDPDALND